MTRNADSAGAVGVVTLGLAFALAASAAAAQRAGPGRVTSLRAPGTYYVALPANGGADTNHGDSTHPWATPQHAADQELRPGDTVIVRAGTYAGFRRVDRPGGTASRPITFKAETGAAVKLDRYPPNPVSRDGIINIINTAKGPARPGHYVIEGFEVDGSQPNNGNGIRLAGSTNNVVRNNRVHHAQETGIFASRCDGILIENNECYRAGDEHGIYVNGTSGYTIRGNHCHDNGANGIHTNVLVPVNQINDNGVIENNVVTTNGLSGMDLTGMHFGRVVNNLVYGNSKQAISLQNGNAYDRDGKAVAYATEAGHDNVIVNNTLDSSHPSDDGSSPAEGAAIQFSIRETQPACAAWTSNEDNTTVFNNILMPHGGGAAIGTKGAVPPSFRSEYNITVGDRFSEEYSVPEIEDKSDWHKHTGQDAHTFDARAADLFVDHAKRNLRLKAGSLAIDAGVETFNSKSAPKTDREGDAAPDGDTTWDVGCDRYRAVGPARPAD
jgi:parallel beta-helix repeat protein